MTLRPVRTWRAFALALDQKRERQRDNAGSLDEPRAKDQALSSPSPSPKRAAGRAQTTSPVDALLPPVSFVSAFEANLVAFCARLPARSRRVLVDDFVSEALRDGLAATLFARGERNASLKVSAAATPEDLRALGDAIGKAPANWALLYAAEELLRAAKSDDAASTAFCLRRAGQLLALVPRQQGASPAAAKDGASVAIFATQPSNRFATDLDIARAIGQRIQRSLERRRRKGWAALAPLLSEVNCYFGKIPERKRKLATDKLQFERQLLLGLIDLSVMGSAASCCCILSDGIAVRNDWAAKEPGQFVLPFSKLAGARPVRPTLFCPKPIAFFRPVAAHSIEPAWRALWPLSPQ